MEEEQGKVVSLSTPRLNALEKLYVRVYLSTLSHPRAHEAVSPGIKKPREENPYSLRDNVQFHINLALQERAEALSLTPDLIIERLYKEGTREGAGANHAARVQALVQLGKHFGLFQEKKEGPSHVFNIINYSSDIKEEVIELEKIEDEILEDDVDQLQNVILTKY